MAEANHPIRVARKAALLSQRELASMAGLTEMTVWTAEAGRSVSAATKKALLQALELPIEDVGKYFPEACGNGS